MSKKITLLNLIYLIYHLNKYIYYVTILYVVILLKYE